MEIALIHFVLNRMRDQHQAAFISMEPKLGMAVFCLRFLGFLRRNSTSTSIDLKSVELLITSAMTAAAGADRQAIAVEADRAGRHKPSISQS